MNSDQKLILDYEDYSNASISCAYMKNGCTKLNNFHIQDHVKSCEFQNTSCCRCDKSVLQKDLIHHFQTSCVKLPRNIEIGTKLVFKTTHGTIDAKGRETCHVVYYQGEVTKLQQQDKITIRYLNTHLKTYQIAKDIYKWTDKIQYVL